MIEVPYLWHPQPSRKENIYVAFKSVWTSVQDGQVKIRLFGNTLYRLYLDGVELSEGPARFAPDHPEYDLIHLDIRSGLRILTVIVHDYGVDTRILMRGIAPFMQCELSDSEGMIPLQWKCKELFAYKHTGRRINGQLGWMEYCDTRLLLDLHHPYESSDEWIAPVEIEAPLGEVRYEPKTINDCKQIPVNASIIGEGTFADRFGYENDDPPIRFISRDLYPSLPADGTWYRLDLSKVGLYRTQVSVEVPLGTLIEVGYAETLTDGRVYPVIPLSSTTSCHMDRWIAQGGKQQFQTFSPRGYRYMEVCIYASKDQINELQVSGIQRTSFSESTGSFVCNDGLLNRVWELGVETLRACSEDALIDTPSRERGQWLGDAALIGMEMLSVSFGDLALIKRSLLQASYRRSLDGVAAGLYPGDDQYLTSYALYWLRGCLRYSQLTGDLTLLEPCYETACKTIDYFIARLTSRGATRLEMWDFLDWGHAIGPEEINVSLNLLLFNALSDIQRWEQSLGFTDMAAKRLEQIAYLRSIIETQYFTDDGLLAKSIPQDGGSLQKKPEIGYHATVLGLLFGIIDAQHRNHAVDFIKRHLMQCFPNRIDAPRLAHPSANSDLLITPSFAYFSLQALWEAGESEFVLGQYRSCWGWMLDQGVTTLLEVFDTRWSHSHAWSGSPTWQLSRYALGVIPDTDKGPGNYLLQFQPGDLEFAEGTIPLLHDQGVIRVQWRRKGVNCWHFEMASEQPIIIRLKANQGGVRWATDDNSLPYEAPIRVQDKLDIVFRLATTD